jgi:hypothetical protein
VLGIFIWSIGNPTRLEPPFNPLPSGFPQSSAAVIGMYSLTAALSSIFFLAITVVAALVTKNRYLVGSMPLLVHLALVYSTPIQQFPQFNPLLNLQLNNEHISLVSILVFWLAGISICVLIAILLTARREGLD